MATSLSAGVEDPRLAEFCAWRDGDSLREFEPLLILLAHPVAKIMSVKQTKSKPHFHVGSVFCVLIDSIVCLFFFWRRAEVKLHAEILTSSQQFDDVNCEALVSIGIISN